MTILEILALLTFVFSSCLASYKLGYKHGMDICKAQKNNRPGRQN